MTLIHQLAFYFHVTFGACALLLFWVPVFTRKGNLDHKRFGRYFARAMYTVAGSGAIMASLDLLAPLAMHARNLLADSTEGAAVASDIRSSALFLLSLSVLVFTTTRQGWLAILHKADRRPLRHPVHLALCFLLVAVGLALLINAFLVGSVLFMIFAGLEITTGIGSLRYNLKASLEPREWWLQHLSGLIGSGIGAYTAFFVFGGNRLFSSVLGGVYAGYGIVLWLAPGVIGGIAITLLTRRYRTRFADSWTMKRAEIHAGLAK